MWLAWQEPTVWGSSVTPVTYINDPAPFQQWPPPSLSAASAEGLSAQIYGFTELLKSSKCSRSGSAWTEVSKQPMHARGKQETCPEASCWLGLDESAAVDLCLPLSTSARERTKIITQSINKIWSPFGNNQWNRCKCRRQEHHCRAFEQNFRVWGADPHMQKGALKPVCDTPSQLCVFIATCMLADVNSGVAEGGNSTQEWLLLELLKCLQSLFVLLLPFQRLRATAFSLRGPQGYLLDNGQQITFIRATKCKAWSDVKIFQVYQQRFQRKRKWGWI